MRRRDVSLAARVKRRVRLIVETATNEVKLIYSAADDVTIRRTTFP